MPADNETPCANDGCEESGEYVNDYFDGLYCLNHHEGIMDRYYDSDDDQDSDDDDDDDDRSSRTIHNYSYKPRPSFMRSDGSHSAYVSRLAPTVSKSGNLVSSSRTTLTMGFELETQCTDDDSFDSDIPQQLLLDVNSSHESDIYLKEDGSVYNGFEIVSHPGELDYFMNHFKWNGIEKLARKGFQAWKRPCCGLHIHVAKSAFADTAHKFKFIAFVYKNRSEMVQLSGRESHDYASYDLKRFLNSHRDWVDDNGKLVRATNLIKMAKGEDHNQSRSVAVNIQPEKTIELRLFRPSLKTETVKVALQFCDALFNYSEHITTHDILQKDALTFPEFRKWVTLNNEKYKVLDTRISEKVKIKSTGRDV
jgi:hypothetical protein